MNEYYQILFESIGTKCQQEHWFGPQLFSPSRYGEVSADNPNRFGFVFPPASKEEVQETEKALGFPLPPLLSTLYTKIANGGFGPGAGLEGAIGGYGRPGTGLYPTDDYTIVAQYRRRSQKGTFDITEHTKSEVALQTRVDLEVPYGKWLRHLLPICDLGCMQEVCIDNQERMFLVAPLESNDRYWLVQLPWTLEEWLWRWLRDEELIPEYL